MTKQSGALSADSLAAETAIEKKILERSHLHFTSHFFKVREGQRFLIGPHHRVMARTLDRVISGEILRLIINVPPGFTKTEEAVIAFMARGLAIEPKARFIHATYSDPLALENSTKARDIVESPEFQAHWPMTIRDDTDAKNLWRTVEGGGVKAGSAAGPITGFRAGQMFEGFSGALIIDDPIKPDDARSPVKREAVNKRYMSTLRNRLAHERVPIILIQQRLDDDDMSGFLLKGGGGEIFHHLWLPAEISHNRAYPREWSHGLLIEHDLPEGPLWPEKLNEDQLRVLKTDRLVYAAQYDQQPTLEEGDYFSADWLIPVANLPPRDTMRVYGGSDYAVTADGGDYTVHCVVGVDPDGKLWLLDLWRGQAASDTWVEAFCDLVRKWRPLEWAEETGQIRAGVGPFLDRRMRERQAYVKRTQFPTRGDKAVRAQSIRGRMALDGLRVPAAAPWRSDFVSELMRFPAGVTDDQCDAIGLVGQLLDKMSAGQRPDKNTIKIIKNDYKSRDDDDGASALIL